MLHLTWHSYISMLSSMVNKEILRRNQMYCTSVRWYEIRFQLNNKLFFYFASDLLLISLKLFVKMINKGTLKSEVIDILTAKTFQMHLSFYFFTNLLMHAWLSKENVRIFIFPKVPALLFNEAISFESFMRNKSEKEYSIIFLALSNSLLWTKISWFLLIKLI